MKGDCYHELVEVFYNNVKEVDGNIHSCVKGVDIIINNDMGLKIADLKDAGKFSHKFDCPQNKKRRKIEMFKSFMRMPTNWVAIFKWHILDVGTNDWHRLPYGVFISKVLEECGVNLTKENKLTCSKANIIGKATLTCIGLKRTIIGWIFSDEPNRTKRKKTSSCYNSDQEFTHGNTEFERRVGNRFKMTTKSVCSKQVSINLE
ncbi:hypothetical protein V8G54_033972 [Vigna mungo]|uniref:Uncharacterized protein n=1 Tax=Vigna mungo TaxID=3915 RepID=A0AAQ3MNV4_VIGMU